MLYDAGYAGLSWPKRVRRRRRDAKLRAIFNEELDRAGAPERLNIVGEDFAGPTIIEFGTEAQQERYLRPILTGDEIWCQLFSEPEAGSDLASLRTTATKVDGGWRIQGQKIWTSRAQLAAHAILLARTGGGPRHKGITYFLLPMDSPGVDVRPLAHMLGEAEFNEVFLDDVFIPDDGVLGDVDGGWQVAMATLAFERVAIATGRVNTTGAVNDLIREIAGPHRRGRHARWAPIRWCGRRIADLYGRALVHYLIGQRVITGAAGERTARTGDLDRQAVLLPAGRGHRRLRAGARRDGRAVRAGRKDSADAHRPTASAGCAWRTRLAARPSPAARRSSSATSSPSASSACPRAERRGPERLK